MNEAKIRSELEEIREIAIPLRNEHSWNLYNRHIYWLVREQKPEFFVESGVAGGQTTFVVLKAMDKNNKGILFSFDPGHKYREEEMENSYYDPSFLEKEPADNVPEELKERWRFTKEFFVKAAKISLRGLEGKIDMFFHDSDHSFENIKAEFKLMENYVRPNGFYMIHDEPAPYVWDNFKLIQAEKMAKDTIVKHGLKIFKKR